MKSVPLYPKYDPTAQLISREVDQMISEEHPVITPQNGLARGKELIR